MIIGASMFDIHTPDTISKRYTFWGIHRGTHCFWQCMNKQTPIELTVEPCHRSGTPRPTPQSHWMLRDRIRSPCHRCSQSNGAVFLFLVYAQPISPTIWRVWSPPPPQVLTALFWRVCFYWGWVRGPPLVSTDIWLGRALLRKSKIQCFLLFQLRYLILLYY